MWSGVPLSTSPVPLSPTYLSVRTFACVPHCVARIVPHCVARIHSPMQARVGVRACACARAACSPALGRGLCPFRLRHRTGRRRACLPRRPDSLQPFPPVSPERGGAFGSSPPANRLSTCRRYACLAVPKTRDPARAGATVGRNLPAVRACQVWGLVVQHRRRSLDDCPPFSLEIWGSVKRRFFP